MLDRRGAAPRDAVGADISRELISLEPPVERAVLVGAPLKRSAERPTIAEIRDRLAQLEPVDPPISPADIIREERDSR